jgi:hypothetical protein
MGESQPTRSHRHPERFCLTNGDIALLKLIYEYRFVRIDNLVVLAGRSYKKIHGRLFKLAANGYVKRIRLPLQKHIYGLGAKALPVLVEQGTASVELVVQRLRSHELKELFLKHELMVADIHTMLAAAATDEIKLVAWKEGIDLYDRVEIPDRRFFPRILPIRPDALFTLVDGTRPADQSRLNFFLEADRSTTTHARFEEKLVAYWHYLRQALHTKKFGIRSFRVLTIALTPERARNLCALAGETLPAPAHRYFLFGSLESFSLAAPARILGPVLATPRGTPHGSLVPLVPLRPELASERQSA